MAKQLTKQGIVIRTGAGLETLDVAVDGVTASMKGADGKIATEAFSHVIVAIGILPNTEGIGLEALGVETERGHIKVDGYGRTNVPGIHAIGDVTGAPWLAHKASHEGIVCVEKIAGLDPAPVRGVEHSRLHLFPPAGSRRSVSPRPRRRRRAYEVKVGKFPFIGNGKAIALGEAEGFVKTVFDAGTGELLGAHMIGAEVTELIQGYVVARQLETTEAELMETVFAHPTLSEMMHEIGAGRLWAGDPLLKARAAALAAAALLGASPPPGAADYLADARSLDGVIARRYAYLDRFPGGTLPPSAPLVGERERVHDRDSLLRYAEHRLLALADHHAITARSFADDWALVPSFADLWIERGADGGYRVDAVRRGSPAGIAGVVAGDRLIAVGGVPVERAVAAFWAPTGQPPVADADSFAARVLAAGRRDRSRVLDDRGRRGRAHADAAVALRHRARRAPSAAHLRLSAAARGPTRAGADPSVRLARRPGHGSGVRRLHGPPRARRHRFAGPHRYARRRQHERRARDHGLVRGSPDRLSGPYPARGGARDRHRAAVDRTGLAARGQASCGAAAR